MKTFIFVALALIGVASAHVIREATVADAFAKAEKDFKDFGVDFLKYFGFENENDFKNQAHEGGKKVAESVDKLAADIKEKTEQLKDSPAIKELNETVKKALDDFKSKNPNADGFINDASKATEEIFNKLRSIGDSDESHAIKDLSKDILQTASKAFTQLRDEFVKKPEGQ